MPLRLISIKIQCNVWLYILRKNIILDNKIGILFLLSTYKIILPLKKNSVLLDESNVVKKEERRKKEAYILLAC